MKKVAGRKAKDVSRWNELESGGGFWSRGGAWLAPTAHDEEQILPRFIALENAPLKERAWFMDLYGMLNICQHGVPAGHPHFPGQTDLCKANASNETERVWRIFAAEARGILGLIRDLKKPKGVGTARDWEALWFASHYRSSPWKATSDPWHQRASKSDGESMLDASWNKEMRQIVVSHSINVMLRYASRQPMARWPGEVQSACDDELSVSGKIGLALRNELSGQAAPRICRACSKPFEPSKYQKRFCEACQDAGIPNRMHVAESRARAKQQ